MCRLAAYAGPPVPLSRLLYDPPRSLSELAVAPREQQAGRINADGTGVAWFVEGEAAPLRYRTQLTPWSDPNLAELAPRLQGHVILAAVRSASPGIPHGASFVHPFVAGGLAGTHNGLVTEFRTRVARPLMAELSDESFAALAGMSDTNVLFLLAVDAHREGASLLEAGRHATAVTKKICEAQGAQATLTLALADEGGVVVVNEAVGRPANSLYVSDGRPGHLVASEPLDPDAGTWVPVPQGAAAVLSHERLEVES